MKKVLATLLAVLLTFSAIAVYSAAEGGAETAGAYTWPAGDSNALVPLNADNGSVTILQAGDVIRFEAITHKKATEESPKIVEVVYYPDAASVSSAANSDWAENYVEKYDLDTTKWKLDSSKGEKAEDFYAKSPNFYKSFATSDGFVYGDEPELKIVGMKADAISARDSERIERGVAPIDFALNNAKFKNAQFVGWVVKSVTWNKNSTTKATVEVYALWDRHPGEDPSGGKPSTSTPSEDESKVYDNPVAKALDKVLAIITKIREWILPVIGAPGPAIGMFLTGSVRPWLYKLFGIEA